MRQAFFILIAALLVAGFTVAVRMGSAFFTSGWPVAIFAAVMGTAIAREERRNRKRMSHSRNEASVAEELLDQQQANLVGDDSGGGGDGD
jgi:hypothetical protein